MKLRRKKIKGVVWDQQEPGWWLSELGGVCLELDGWYFWIPPTEIGLTPVKKKGPFETMRAAMEAAKEGE